MGIRLSLEAARNTFHIFDPAQSPTPVRRRCIRRAAPVPTSGSGGGTLNGNSSGSSNNSGGGTGGGSGEENGDAGHGDNANSSKTGGGGDSGTGTEDASESGTEIGPPTGSHRSGPTSTYRPGSPYSTGLATTQAPTSRAFLQATGVPTRSNLLTDPTNDRQSTIPTEALSPPTSAPRPAGNEGSSPGTAVIVAAVGGAVAGLLVLILLGWVAYRLFQRWRQRKMIMGAEPSIPVRFVPEAPAPHFRAGLSVSSNQEKHHPATADIPELLDTSIRLHEMPGTVIENTDNRHEMATPDVVMTPNRLETPDFGDIELDFRSIDGESDMGERRPTSWL